MPLRTSFAVRLFSTVTAAALPFLAHVEVRACAGLVQTQTGTVAQSGQLVILSTHDDVTDVTITLDVPEAGNAFGALVPVPEEPIIDPTPVDTTAIDALEEETRPAVHSTADSGAAAGGCGCGDVALGGDSTSKGRNVSLGEAVDIGPVTAQWVNGTSGNAIADWLSTQGFTLPADATPIVQSYLDQGMSFVAFTRNASAAGAARVGVRFTLDGDRRVVALGNARIGAAEELSFVVFVATASALPIGPDAPYTALGIADLGTGGVLDDDDYAGAVRAAVAEAGGKAFVVESMASAASLSTNAASLLPDGSTVTRLSTVAKPADLTVDATFTDELEEGSVRAIGRASPVPPPPRPPWRLDLAIWSLLTLLGARAALRRVGRLQQPAVARE